MMLLTKLAPSVELLYTINEGNILNYLLGAQFPQSAKIEMTIVHIPTPH